MYKSKYLLAIYNKDEECITVADSVKELADFLGRDIMNLRPIVSRCYKKQDKHIQVYFDKEMFDLYLIDYYDEEN